MHLLSNFAFNLSYLAYKLREKIGKALKTRATAIQRALADYNAAAILLNPPRQQLTWAEVANTVTLAEFDLLRDTRSDIRKLPWAEPARREAMVLYFGIKRAKEEIRRLNVEIRRLITFMIDDHADYWKAIQARSTSSSSGDLALAHELRTQLEHRSNINRSIAQRLVRASKLVGFTGSLLPGERVGRDMELNNDVPFPAWAVDTLGLTQITIEDDEDDDISRELRDVDVELLQDVMDRLQL